MKANSSWRTVLFCISLGCAQPKGPKHDAVGKEVSAKSDLKKILESNPDTQSLYVQDSDNGLGKLFPIQIGSTIFSLASGAQVAPARSTIISQEKLESGIGSKLNLVAAPRGAWSQETFKDRAARVDRGGHYQDATLPPSVVSRPAQDWDDVRQRFRPLPGKTSISGGGDFSAELDENPADNVLSVKRAFRADPSAQLRPPPPAFVALSNLFTRIAETGDKPVSVRAIQQHHIINAHTLEALVADGLSEETLSAAGGSRKIEGAGLKTSKYWETPNGRNTLDLIAYRMRLDGITGHPLDLIQNVVVTESHEQGGALENYQRSYAPTVTVTLTRPLYALPYPDPE